MRKKRLMKTALLFCITGAVFLFGGCQNKEKQTELESFYGLVSEDQYVILLEGENSGIAYKQGDEIYLPYETVNNQINDKFYYDEEYKRILFTTPDEIEMYEMGKDANTKEIQNQVYIALSCIKQRTEMNCEVYDNPKRIAISKNFGKITVCHPKEDTVIRQFNRDGADYMAKVSKGESLVIKEKMDENWYRVVKENGITGYIKIADTDGEQIEERTCEFKTEDYFHIMLDKTICLGWHQMESTAGNATLGEVVSSGEGILNVVSPTWFKLTDTEGNISSLAESAYVAQAHEKGLQVWALADDFSYGTDGNYYIGTVIGDYDTRQNLINNLVNEVTACGADGLNIDYEKIHGDIADDYIQFIRELSIECRKKKIVLSVDTYVPQSYNEFYNRKGIAEVADYLVIMGYDEHWAGGREAGSVASFPYVEQGIEDTLVVADANRVINAVPFYTRIWVETPDGQTTEGTYVEDAINGNYWLSSTAVGMSKAERNLSSKGVTPVWLEDLKQYYGEYKNEAGENVRIWLEEEKSIDAKLDFMKEKGLAGVACWKLTLEKSTIWDVLNEYINGN